MAPNKRPALESPDTHRSSSMKKRSTRRSQPHSVPVDKADTIAIPHVVKPGRNTNNIRNPVSPKSKDKEQSSAISISSSSSSDEDKALESPARSNIVEKVTEALAPPSIYAGAGKIADETALSDGGAAETAKDAAPNHADEAVDGQVLHTEEEEARLAFGASSADHNQKTKLFVATMYASKDRRVQLYKEKEEEARKLEREKEELKENNKRLEREKKQLKRKIEQLEKHAEKLRRAFNDFNTLQTEGPTTSSDAEHSEQGEGYDNGEEENEDDVTVEVHRTPLSQSKW